MNTRTRNLVLFGLFTTAAWASACSSKSGTGAAGSASAGGKGGKRGGAGQQYSVEVARVDVVPVEYVVNAPGTIEAFEQVQITARVAGVIDHVGFAEGVAVKKGQVLASIESERYQLVVNAAQATLVKMQAAEAGAADDVSRREGASVAHPGLIPGEELATYRTKLSLAKADTMSAQEALKQAALNLRDSYARAPITGVIQTRSVQTGQYVQTGMALGTLLQRDPLLLRFQVSAEDAPRLKPGMIANFALRESQRSYPAKITLVSGTADAKSRLVPVTAEIDDTQHQYWLRPGAYCEVTITVGDARLAPVVPQLAIRPNERGFLAFVVENGVAKERVLKLGMHTLQGTVEVTDGLKAGEMLVVRGAEPLIDGSPVRIVDADGGAPVARGSRDGGTGGPSPSGSAASGGDGAGTHMHDGGGMHDGGKGAR